MGKQLVECPDCGLEMTEDEYLDHEHEEEETEIEQFASQEYEKHDCEADEVDYMRSLKKHKKKKTPKARCDW